MKNVDWPLVFGVFIGNWLIIPLVFKTWSFTQAFFTGLLAAIICAILTAVL